MTFNYISQFSNSRVGFYALGVVVFIIQGCASGGYDSYSSGPRKKTTYSHTGGSAENEKFSVKITPKSRYSFAGPSEFNISIQNKTDSTLEIDWNRTLFLDNGQSRGTFMFEGIKYNDKNSQKAPDIIGPNSSFRKWIVPSANVSFSSSWSHGRLLGYSRSSGKYGVSLSVKVDGKEVRQSVELTITKSETYE